MGDQLVVLAVGDESVSMEGVVVGWWRASAIAWEGVVLSEVAILEGIHMLCH